MLASPPCGVSAGDIPALSIVGIVLAYGLPACRAMRVDPTVALRND